MNEVIRIHLAKTAYDVEVAAKKELEKYTKSLESYTQDKDVLVDIEIRMTEILSERGVPAGGVIGSGDVRAIREQLGEPYEFADESGDIAVGTIHEDSTRRLYRNTDTAVLGGVLGGAATYLNVNPVWLRLAFIVLMFMSFGLAIVVYVVCWLIIPPARTAAEKLQLAGKPATLGSIRELNESEDSVQPNKIAPTLQRILSLTFGSLSLLTALCVLAVTIAGITATINHKDVDQLFGMLSVTGEYAGIGWLVYWIVVFGAAMLVTLLSLVGYAFLARKLTKKMIISGVVIIVLGVASVATSIGIASAQSWQAVTEAQSSVRETKSTLAKEFSGVSSIKFSAEKNSLTKSTAVSPSYIAVEYIVDEGTPRYELSALPNTKVKVAIDGSAAMISVDIPTSPLSVYIQPRLVIYGPALASIDTELGQLRYAAASQESLEVTSREHGYFVVDGGDVEKVVVGGSGSVDLGATSVETLTVNAQQNLYVNAGTVRELAVSQPEVCPVGGSSASTSVVVEGVVSENMSYNGKEIPAVTHRTNCAEVVIGLDTLYNREY